MDAAIRSARASFPAFVSRLTELRDKGAYFSIKVPIQTGSNTEHIWLTAPEVRDGQVTGKLGNDPLAGSRKLGDTVTVPSSEVSDWMAIVNDELYGGYTVIVAREQMSEAEKSEFDHSVSFRVPAVAREFAEPAAE